MEEKGFTARERLRQVLGAADLMASRPPIPYPILGAPSGGKSDEPGMGCFHTGPGRGDCEHFIGMPSVVDGTTTDVYGKPRGWCWTCWRVYQLRRNASALRTALAEEREACVQAAKCVDYQRRNWPERFEPCGVCGGCRAAAAIRARG